MCCPFHAQLYLQAASRDDIVSLQNCIQELTHEISGIVRNTSELLQQHSQQRSGGLRGTQRTSGRHNPIGSDDDSDADDEEDIIPPRRTTGPVCHRKRSQNKTSVCSFTLLLDDNHPIKTVQRDVKKHTKLLFDERVHTFRLYPLPKKSKIGTPDATKPVPLKTLGQT